MPHRIFLRHGLGHALIAACLLAPGTARAQTQDNVLLPRPVPPEDPAAAAQPTAMVHDSAAVYLPADFAQFAPRNALDMLHQIPGFTIQQQSSARGLGQASGNILINGVRFSGKSVSAQEQLARIPAGNVIRIEIIDGAALDIPGLSGRIANVIARTTGHLSGRFEWRGQYSTGVAPFRWSQGDISLTGRSGPVDFTIALQNPSFYGGSEGPSLITDGSGHPDPRINRNISKMDRPTISGNFEIDLPGSAIANLNLSYNRGFFRLNEREYRTSALLAPLEKTLRNRSDDYNYEIGGDVDVALGVGRLKLIALESFRHNAFSTQSLVTEAGAPFPRGSRFEQESDSGERIGRAEYRWPMWRADWQISAEAAFNRLDKTAHLFLLDPHGEFFEVPFPSGTGGVREDRYETALTYGRPLTGRLTLQVTAGGEYSRIAQTGANALSRSFRRPKGSLSLAWKADPRLDVSLKLARRVGQLNFNDFLANVNLGDDNTNAGNNQLRPQQSWDLDLELARSLGPWGSARLTLSAERITDYVTIVPIATGGESPGNIPRASSYSAHLDTTVNFDPIGFRGARLNLKALLVESGLADPVTGHRRAFDNERARQIEMDFRHDIPNTSWVWGGEFRATRFMPYYRVAETGLDYNVNLFGAVFIEHKDVFGLTVRLRAANLFRREIVFSRTVYAGPRGSSPILFSEDRRREIGGIFNITVSGSF